MPDHVPGVIANLIAAATDLIELVTDDEVHTVGAAVRTTDGTIVTGINLYHFTGGPCAELVALANVAAVGATPFTIVAVGSHGRGVIAPCGRCRQVLVDYWPDTLVVLPGPDGPRVVSASDLLPDTYRRPNDEEWETMTGTR